ncbi:DNA-binding IclR family transcriptional regulator [Roseovarius sp. MBR-51]
MQAVDKPNAIISLERGLDLLRAFRCEEKSLGIHDLSRLTGLPKATVARLAHTLVTLGYLGQTHFQGRYHLADKVFDLGTSFLSSMPVCRVAAPVLQDIADQFNMSTALGIGDQADMVYLAYCRGKDTVTLRMRTGALIPMDKTAMGRAFLWAIGPEQRAFHLKCIEESGADMAVVAEHIEKSTAEIEATGFCTSLGDWRRDIYAVSVPLVIDNGKTVLAINCGASRHGLGLSMFREEIGPTLKVAAREINNTMEELRYNFWND